jgi:hypothetical protein
MAEDNEQTKAAHSEDEQTGMSEDEIDRNLMGTFPASDPPSWTLGTDHVDESPERNGEVQIDLDE